MARKNHIPFVSLLALSMALPAVAQVQPAQPAQPAPQAEPQAEPQERDRDVVVVTAQKREETVQDIAIAVTAITSKLRDEVGLQSLQDYTNFAPGLTYSVANDRIGMRGVNRNTNNFGVRTGIANYVDGFYYPSSIPGQRAALFVDRVEVVRGPQGTLYGRDSIGGALNVISKRPSEEFHADLNLGAGSFDTMKVETSITGPITDGLRFRLNAARDKQGKGFLTNAAGLESEGLRNDGSYYEGQLAGNLGDSFEWFIRGAHTWWSREGAPGARTSAGNMQEYDSRLFAPNSTQPNSAYGFNAISHTQVGSFIGNPAVNDSMTFNSDVTGLAQVTNDEAVAEAIYHAPGFDIKYVGGYGWYKYNHVIELDDTPVTSYEARVYPFSPAGTLATIRPGSVQDYTENKAWFSNEVNLISTYDGPVQFIAGLYQYQENFDQPVYRYFTSPPPNPIVLRTQINPATGAVTGVVPSAAPTYKGQTVFLLTANRGIADSFGAFTQVDWQINDNFRLTGGLRQSQDYSRIEERGRTVCYYTTTCAAVGANAAIPGADVTDNGFFGAQLSVFPNGSPGVVGTSATDPSGAFTDPVTGNRTRRLKDQWEATTGMLRLDWTPNDDTLVYANYARGYKGGGFNASTFSPVPEVGQESIDSYELGWKQDLDALNLTINSDVFFYNYDGYQVPNTVVPLPDPVTGLITPYTAFVNLPKVETTGVEIETTWSPTREFKLLVNYGYVNPEITEATGLVDSADPLARLPDAKPFGAVTGARYNAAGQLIDGQIGQDLSGNIVPFTPKNKVSVNALYTFDFDAGSLTASATYDWQDSQYSTIFNRYTNKTPAWDQVDARLLWNSSDGHWTIIGFIKNMLNEKQYDGRTSGLRRADAVAAGTTPTSGGTGSTARPIAQTMSFCGSTPATTIDPTGNGGNGVLAESCMTNANFYRMPRWGGIELQFHF